MTGWRSAPLGEVAELQAGVAFPPALQGRFDGELPLAKVGDISRAVRAGSHGLLPPLHHISRGEAHALRARIFPPGTTVFAKVGETIAQNFRLLTDQEAVFDNNVMGAIPRPLAIEPRYLFRFLQTVDLYAYVAKTAVPALRKSELARLPVPLPDARMQRRIADILDKADAIHRKRSAAVALAAELVRSTFLELLGDLAKDSKEGPSGCPLEWKIWRLGELCDVAGGLQVSRARAGHPLSLPYLRVANVFRDRLDLGEVKQLRVTPKEAERAALVRGDVLVVEGHGNPDELGRAAVFHGEIAPCTHQNHLIRVRADPSRLRPAFLSAFLNSASGRAQLLRLSRTTCGLNTLSTRNVRSIELPVPPLLRQEAFERIADQARQLAGRLAGAQRQSAALFASLVQRAFRGDLSAW